MSTSPVSPAELDRGLREVGGVITTLAGRTTPLQIDASGMGRLGTLPTPVQRRAAKAGFSFSNTPAPARIAIWDHIWRTSELMEVRHQAIYAYQYRPLQRQELRRILKWTETCSCWEHSDDLSKIYADALEANPDWVMPTLERWGRSPNPWQRRQSVVALIEYASKRQRFLPFDVMIRHVEALLDDEDYYVQKGVGWTIREIGNAYPQEIAPFLAHNVSRLSPQAWSGATKNMAAEAKARLKALRKGPAG